jgi:hypothetical protein
MSVWWKPVDRLCGLVVRVSGYRSRDPGYDSRRYQISWELVALEQGRLSPVSTIEELPGRNSWGSNVGNWECGHGGLLRWPVQHPLSAKGSTNFPYKPRSLCRYSSVADLGHNFFLFFFLLFYGSLLCERNFPVDFHDLSWGMLVLKLLCPWF